MSESTICVVVICLIFGLFLLMNIADRAKMEKSISNLWSEIADLKKKTSSKNDESNSYFYSEFNNLKKYVNNNIVNVRNSINANTLDIKIHGEALDYVANKLDEYDKILEKKDELENESDLLTNFLAAYAQSNADDFNLLKSVQRYITTWECFYNYSLIFLNKNQYNECLMAMKNCKENCTDEMDDYNKIKEKFLNFYILQNLFDGFDIHKISNINQEVETLLKDENFKKNSDFPYFYNNYLNTKKDFESPNEIIKKLDSFLNNEKFNPLEKKIFLKNKINFLIRGNKIQEAMELLNKEQGDKDDDDLDFLLMKSFLHYKNEKDKFEEVIQKDSLLKNKIVTEAFILQILLSTLSLKNYENFHHKILSFVDNFRAFCLNSKFIIFFIGFYNSKKLHNYLKEFLAKFNKPEELFEHNKDQRTFKDLLMKIADALYKLGDYSQCSKLCQFYLEKVSQYDTDIKLLHIQCLSHVDLPKCDEFRRSFDDMTIDLSYEHVNGLLNEFFSKFGDFGACTIWNFYAIFFVKFFHVLNEGISCDNRSDCNRREISLTFCLKRNAFNNVFFITDVVVIT